MVVVQNQGQGDGKERDDEEDGQTERTDSIAFRHVDTPIQITRVK